MSSRPRYVILDALRGFAILGICLANFPEFSLWTFADPASHPASDRVVQALLTFFVDGKFYTLFSILFGIGFSIQLDNADGRLRTFYRRMGVLFGIGLLHLLFLWSGDILMLYAAMGMLLPLFRRCPTRRMLTTAGVLLLLPVLSDAVLGGSLSDPIETAQWRICSLYGITEANFGTWLRDASSYREVFQFLQQGAVERMWEFVSSHRYFKVLGLFLIGFAIGRERIYADLPGRRALLRKVFLLGLGLGLPVSVLYTLSAVGAHPWGTVAHSVLYLLSVYPMGLAYAAGFCLLYERSADAALWKVFSRPGRVACTNYLMQSLLGVLLFYGIGLGLGAGVTLAQTEAIALGVYALEVLASHLWLRYFRYGPVEWLWRMLTYAQPLPLLRERDRG
ncbi:MAG: DUF418 domain-containing protein [Bacteroidales bacterium]|nr:DUF418 domain-containing protein [Bacteroidales bacterium]